MIRYNNVSRLVNDPPQPLSDPSTTPAQNLGGRYTPNPPGFRPVQRGVFEWLRPYVTGGGAKPIRPNWRRMLVPRRPYASICLSGHRSTLSFSSEELIMSLRALLLSLVIPDSLLLVHININQCNVLSVRLFESQCQCLL